MAAAAPELSRNPLVVLSMHPTQGPDLGAT